LNPAIFFTRLFVQKICGKVLNYSSRWHGVWYEERTRDRTAS
jgi:hypothetical protein